jgi:hypothetical protein
MQLSLPDDSAPVQAMFERFFTAESTATRVRAAELTGFDAALWRELIAADAPFMRLSPASGGGSMGLFDACVMMKEAGRKLASALLAESLLAPRILGDVARHWIEGSRRWRYPDAGPAIGDRWQNTAGASRRCRTRDCYVRRTRSCHQGKCRKAAVSIDFRRRGGWFVQASRRKSAGIEEWKTLMACIKKAILFGKKNLQLLFLWSLSQEKFVAATKCLLLLFLRTEDLSSCVGSFL